MAHHFHVGSAQGRVSSRACRESQSPLPPPSACRLFGFRLGLGALALLTVLGALGVANSFLDEYLDFSLAKELRRRT